MASPIALLLVHLFWHPNRHLAAVNQFRSWYNRQPIALRTLIAINVVLYIAWQFLRWIGPVNGFVYNVLALNTEWPGAVVMPWQLLTYNFLHLGAGLFGLLHIAFNMLWLYWIGKEFERMHGPHELLALYILGGVGGGLLSLLFGLLMPGFFGNIIHGASGAVLGVIMAVAILYPYKKVALIFLGTVKLLYLVLGFLAIDALLSLSSSGVAVTAHWGGALAGFLCARAGQRGIDVTSWARFFFEDRSRSRGRRSSQSTHSSSKPKMGFLDRLEMWLGGDPKAGSSSSGSSTDVKESSSSRSSPRSSRSASTSSSGNTDEVDRILDKISEKGYDSLSEEEKRILYEASQS